MRGGSGHRSPIPLTDCWLLRDADLQAMAAGTLFLELGLCPSHRTDTQPQDPLVKLQAWARSVSPMSHPEITSQEHLRAAPPHPTPTAWEVLTEAEVGVLAGLAEICTLGTTQPPRGACSSLMEGASLMVVEPSSLSPARYAPCVPSCVLCLGIGAFYSSRGSCSCPLLSQGLAERTPAWNWNQPQTIASRLCPLLWHARGCFEPLALPAGLALSGKCCHFMVRRGLNQGPGPGKSGLRMQEGQVT